MHEPHRAGKQSPLLEGAHSVSCALGPSTKKCCCCSVAQCCLTLCDPMDCSMPVFPVLHHLPEFAGRLISIESMMLSNHLILYCPLLLLPSVFPSIKVFSNELALHIRPKYWSFSISSCKEYCWGLASLQCCDDFR